MGESYFFLYPVGHFGLTEVTFLLNLPLRQVIVVFLTAFGLDSGLGDDLGDSWESFT
jgi:hypothetical protein